MAHEIQEQLRQFAIEGSARQLAIIVRGYLKTAPRISQSDRDRLNFGCELVAQAMGAIPPMISVDLTDEEVAAIGGEFGNVTVK